MEDTLTYRLIIYVKSLGATAGEARVVVALLKGYTNKKIAAELFLCEKTVKFHLTNVYKKLGVKNRTELVVMLTNNFQAYQKALLPTPKVHEFITT
jgi:DNA-binding CsgD family transcriptional regulator